jgi:hypothetical protein
MEVKEPSSSIISISLNSLICRLSRQKCHRSISIRARINLINSPINIPSIKSKDLAVRSNHAGASVHLALIANAMKVTTRICMLQLTILNMGINTGRKQLANQDRSINHRNKVLPYTVGLRIRRRKEATSRVIHNPDM